MTAMQATTPLGQEMLDLRAKMDALRQGDFSSSISNPFSAAFSFGDARFLRQAFNKSTANKEFRACQGIAGTVGVIGAALVAVWVVPLALLAVGGLELIRREKFVKANEQVAEKIAPMVAVLEDMANTLVHAKIDYGRDPLANGPQLQETLQLFKESFDFRVGMFDEDKGFITKSGREIEHPELITLLNGKYRGARETLLQESSSRADDSDDDEIGKIPDYNRDPSRTTDPNNRPGVESPHVERPRNQDGRQT